MQLQDSKHKKKSNVLVIKDGTKGNVICTNGSMANTFRTRLFGLLGRKGLAAGSGLLIEPSSGVHTFGMSFPIDIVSLDRNQRVVGLSHNTPAWKIRGLGLKTRSVLELPAGRIQECEIEHGDQIVVEAC
ncbi:DUF192 domain-containing protein [Granulicella tundricola]|uniref:DUF192 domain-containing protein n=1 Tax=Granulicella tundricola (strain ATCC BAA-1859 / DSM 23138 / MP5ACTX9) TaxID=1198114 RepID=E8WY06_GRATM|nr:DUF192 domain-containing protein [Granulicella tundricola]ADW67545.1 protein of unknown function DUF192 [Granulicella tundricola MP5ACTX9]